MQSRATGWITALKAPQIGKLVRDDALQLSLFDQHNLAEITPQAYPAERLIVCRNPPSGRRPRAQARTTA